VDFKISGKIQTIVGMINEFVEKDSGKRLQRPFACTPEKTGPGEEDGIVGS